MNAPSFLHKVRRALVPMRKATIDAFLLASIIDLLLFVTGVLLTYPWLILLPYALVYVLAFLLRLRQATYQLVIAFEQDQLSERNSQKQSSESLYIELMIRGAEHLGS